MTNATKVHFENDTSRALQIVNCDYKQQRRLLKMMHLYHEHFKGAWWKSPSERGWWLAYSHCQVPSILYNSPQQTDTQMQQTSKHLKNHRRWKIQAKHGGGCLEGADSWLVASFFYQFWKLPSFLFNFESCHHFWSILKIASVSINFENWHHFWKFLITRLCHHFLIVFLMTRCNNLDSINQVGWNWTAQLVNWKYVSPQVQ